MQICAKTVYDFKVAVDELAELDGLDFVDDEFVASLHRDAILYGFMRCLITVKGLFGDIGQLNDGKKYAETELYEKVHKRLSPMFTVKEIAFLKNLLDMADYLEVIAGTQDEDVDRQSLEIISGMAFVIKALRPLVDRFSDNSYVQLVQEA